MMAPLLPAKTKLNSIKKTAYVGFILTVLPNKFFPHIISKWHKKWQNQTNFVNYTFSWATSHQTGWGQRAKLQTEPSCLISVASSPNYSQVQRAHCREGRHWALITGCRSRGQVVVAVVEEIIIGSSGYGRKGTSGHVKARGRMNKMKTTLSPCVSSLIPRGSA